MTRRSLALSVFVLTALLFALPAQAVTIDWVTVGDPGNDPDDTPPETPAGSLAPTGFGIQRAAGFSPRGLRNDCGTIIPRIVMCRRFAHAGHGTPHQVGFPSPGEAG